jgi:hypothetical protein
MTVRSGLAQRGLHPPLLRRFEHDRVRNPVKRQRQDDHPEVVCCTGRSDSYKSHARRERATDESELEATAGMLSRLLHDRIVSAAAGMRRTSGRRPAPWS